MSKTGSKRSSWLRELIVLLVIAVLVAVVVRTFVASSFYIPSGSMEHTLNINDRVLVYKLGYDFHDPNRGDIVVFKAPATWAQETGDGGDWIKRVIAVGGDRVAFSRSLGKITVNGKPLTEPYIHRDENGKQDPPSEAPFSVTVPQGRMWLMGDHRSNSSDSREHYLQSHDVQLSTVPVSSVVGRAFVRYWPIGRTTVLSPPDTFDAVPDSK
ncbi:MAG: signal peptidase I [Actinocatenispora sp.]